MKAAVFVDFENLFLSLKSRSDGLGLKTREACLQILEGLLARLRAEGSPMVLGRSYAAFDTYPGGEVAHDLALMGLDPQYVLISHSGKNSADIQMAVDTARVVFRRTDIQLVVIVSGDGDFIPLARQVLEEGRELVVVAVPDTTSGDLRERVGAERFWSALDLIANRPPDRPRGQPLGMSEPVSAPPQAAPPAAPPQAPPPPPVDGEPSGNGHARADPVPSQPSARGGDEGSNIVGHIPVTWRTQRSVSPEEHEDRLQQCLELMVRAQIRHDSPDIWLSPFLKGPMSQSFSHLVHPDRRALINELRNRGIIRVEERDNMYASHPYSVIVIEEAHPMAQAARQRVMRGS